MIHRILLSFLLFFIVEPGMAGEPALPVAKDWLPSEYVRVVGYRFEFPENEPTSLLQNGKLQSQELQNSKKKETTLSTAQIKRLLDATFASKVDAVPAACYDPHHIFVFYNAAENPVGAIEVCFECGNLETMPQKETRYDLEALARLSSELGLGLGADGQTLEEYLQLLKVKTGEVQ